MSCDAERACHISGAWRRNSASMQSGAQLLGDDCATCTPRDDPSLTRQHGVGSLDSATGSTELGSKASRRRQSLAGLQPTFGYCGTNTLIELAEERNSAFPIDRQGEIWVRRSQRWPN
jgi:hypothetical protein